MGSVNISNKNSQATHLVNYSIYLPFPTAINIGTNFQWAAEEMGVTADLVKAQGRGGIDRDDLKAVIHRAGAQTAATVGGSAAAQYNHDLKRAINPKEEMLFKGADFRQFSLTWELVPTSAAESQAYADAIEAIHEMASPGIDKSGAFFTYPKTTKVVVQKSGGGAPLIDRPDSAITSINVDLTPDGIWAALKDGRPVHTQLTIEFMELTLPTKKNVPKLLG